MAASFSPLILSVDDTRIEGHVPIQGQAQRYLSCPRSSVRNERTSISRLDLAAKLGRLDMDRVEGNQRRQRSGERWGQRDDGMKR